jgi:lipoyl-dependent peroxiredoxin
MHMSQTAKILYTARTHTRGGRENGASRSSDGRLDIRLAIPGSARIGTDPEHLFAAAWSACFESAMALAAHKRKIALPAGVAIDAEVDLNLADSGYFLSARLNVSLPGIERDVAQALINEAHEICPYSKATAATWTLRSNWSEPGPNMNRSNETLRSRPNKRSAP